MSRPETPLHWPGAVGMFLESGTPYYVAPSYRDNAPAGNWDGFAKNGADALYHALRVADRVRSKHGIALTIGQPVKLTDGEAAAVITGANVRDYLPR